MNASSRYWAPKTPPSNVKLILSVDRGTAAQAALDEATYRSLMGEKVARLVAEAGPGAAEILDASAENLPELAAIRANQPEASWPAALMGSDLMMQLLNQINWAKEKGSRPMLPLPSEIKSALREQTLRELIESF